MNRLVALGGTGGGGENADEAERQLAVFNQLTETKSTLEQMRSYSKAMNAYLRGGVEKIGVDARNALSVGAETSGGYWVQPATTGALMKEDLRDLARS